MKREPATPRRAIAAAVAACVLVGGCATSRHPSRAAEDDVGRAVLQPLRDLNLLPEPSGAAIRRAAAAPYAPPTDCRDAQTEILRLDAALGPEAHTSGTAEGLAAAVVREVASLPFRGVVRRLTGAEAAARDARRATLRAIERRGFLQGWSSAIPCPTPPPAIPVTATSRDDTAHPAHRAGAPPPGA